MCACVGRSRGSPYLRKQEASEVSRDLRACSKREREKRREEDDDDDDGDDAYPVGRPLSDLPLHVACLGGGVLIQIGRPHNMQRGGAPDMLAYSLVLLGVLL